MYSPFFKFIETYKTQNSLLLEKMVVNKTVIIYNTLYKINIYYSFETFLLRKMTP